MRRGLVLAAVAPWLVACPTLPSRTDVPPFHDAFALASIGHDERRTWHMADEMDERIARSGTVYEDEALRAYLQGIMDRLYPEFVGHIRVQVLEAPVLNAFCIANGSIYVNAGIIASAENEAQIATVLGHEGAHFTHRHIHRSIMGAKQVAVTAMVGGVAASAAGVPTYGMHGLLAASSMFGFSRDLEREADAEAFRRLVAAGYAADEASVPFERMKAMVEALDRDPPPYVFSTHPRLVERIASFEELAAASPGQGDFRGEDVFRRHTGGVLVAAVEESLGMANWQGVVLALESPLLQQRFPPHWPYYLGEAYRLRGEPGDDERALTAWQQALAAAPSYAPTQRALGRLWLKRGDRVRAREHLERYVALAPRAEDIDYVEQMLAELQP